MKRKWFSSKIKKLVSKTASRRTKMTVIGNVLKLAFLICLRAIALYFTAKYVSSLHKLFGDNEDKDE